MAFFYVDGNQWSIYSKQFSERDVRMFVSDGTDDFRIPLVLTVEESERTLDKLEKVCFKHGTSYEVFKLAAAGAALMTMKRTNDT